MPDKEFKETLKKVNQFKITKDFDIGQFMSSLKETGFNAKRLALACEIYKKMIEEYEQEELNRKNNDRR